MTTILDRLISQSQDSWRADAACKGADTSTFYIGPGKSPHAALTVCDRCEVRRECLQYALDNEEDYGIWGGLNADQRRRLRRRRNDASPPLLVFSGVRAGAVPLSPAVLLPATQ
ncbi:WhiB family transcriptional regulator [Candidatus Poriferisodalis sp.]|uniref:WhiB family transcriptional regulator n=1 Tax=Candidatus Poriferisodalis sp. TaxID=3101277 RepID=UPI003C702DA8